MMIDAKIKVIQRKITSIGFLPTIKLIINRLITLLFYRNYLLFYVNIPNYSVNPEEFGEHLVGKEIGSIDELSPEDIASIQDYTGANYIKEMRRRFVNNWRLFLVYMNSHVAGALWGITNESEFKTKIVPLLDGDIGLIDAWTIPEFRGKNVYPFVLSFAVARVRKKRFKRAFGYIQEMNSAALKGIKKAGFKFFTNYESYKLFGWEWVIWKSKSTMKSSNSLL